MNLVKHDDNGCGLAFGSLRCKQLVNNGAMMHQTMLLQHHLTHAPVSPGDDQPNSSSKRSREIAERRLIVSNLASLVTAEAARREALFL